MTVRDETFPNDTSGDLKSWDHTAAQVYTYTLRSPYQEDETNLRVLVPRNSVPNPRYLYVLPVQPGLQTKYGDGLAEIQALGLHERYGLIVVAPSFSDYPWIIDHPSIPSLWQESYMLKTVLPFVETHHPSTPPKRFLIGFSKGGFSALSLLLRYPDMFMAAGVWDCSMLQNKPLPDILARIAGTKEHFQHYHLPQQLRKQAAYFRDTKRIAIQGYGILREDLHAGHCLMEELGILHDYVDGPQRVHIWGSGWISSVLENLMQMDTS